MSCIFDLPSLLNPCRSSSQAAEFESLVPNDLKDKLHKAIKEIIDNKDTALSLDDLAHAVPLQQLQDLVKTEFPNQKEALETAKNLLSEAKYYLDTQKKSSFSLYGTLTSLVDTLIMIIDTLISYSGIAEIFEPAENNSQLSHKIVNMQYTIPMLYGMLSGTITLLILPIFGLVGTSVIVSSIMLSILAIGLGYPYIRPMPSSLPEGENWTTLARHGHFATIGGRKELLNQMSETLKTSGNHLMLIGKTGMGKTQTAKAFVHAIERGDYPELSGKKVFYFNTANLLNSYDYVEGRDKILKKIAKMIGRHRENVILVFDEIHLACQGKMKSVIGEQLKTMLDEHSERGFAHVIGITTEEEYYRDIYQDHAAFARRFTKVKVDPTEKTETLRIMTGYLLRESPQTIIAKEDLEYLYAKATEGQGVQPGTALAILSQCVTRTSKTQLSEQKKKKEELVREMEFIQSQGALGHGIDFSLDSSNEQDSLDRLEREIKELEKQLRKDNEKLSSLFAAKQKFKEVTDRIYHLVFKLKEAKKEELSSSDQHRLNTFMLLRYFLAPALKQHIVKLSNDLNVKTVIDRALIDEIIAEEQDNLKKMKAAVGAAQAQLKARGE
jgi:ABC-type dipeptide/oligopeptide/nickel transport system ATPase component